MDLARLMEQMMRSGVVPGQGGQSGGRGPADGGGKRFRGGPGGGGGGNGAPFQEPDLD